MFVRGVQSLNRVARLSTAGRGSHFAFTRFFSSMPPTKADGPKLTTIGEVLTDGKDLRPGHFFIHKEHGYRAVVLEVVPRVIANDQFCEDHGIPEEHRNHPYYICLADSRDVVLEAPHFYVSSKMALGYNSLEPLMNPQASILLMPLMNGAHGVLSRAFTN
ncbi:hypothetical protein SARC_03077 [Sphaeroforma arctica JP610]|uniref:Hemimethylated DNA-binding domain-containing protein n=1 Tax=Sphaeroforma arctica JP610 TaxID=667725 RepID=A0A0L0G6Q8_9EUKA|nr:hypothetical protein SARC_03077 [Sphaeroforma arctica JP610]KNC84702.1 hypothetical protein SARC_03077 [Sphaeroforma arctica JP610]|eukprot:XP_014158604.1 hypothetical protein SARC_03077 [Sphaeroforma arctica JP610]